MTPEQRFAQLVATDASRPFVTYYDEATGERSELSVKSLANWVAKTHHLLGDELGLGVGDTALVALPAHWISVPILLGCLTAGLALDIDGSAEVAFVAPATLAQGATALDVLAIAPESAANGFGDNTPAGAADYVAAVRPQADAWGAVRMPAVDDDPCVPGLSRADVLARGERSGLAPGARVLSTRTWSAPADWLDTVLTPLAVGGSVVLVANCTDDAVLDRRAEQERVTDRV